MSVQRQKFHHVAFPRERLAGDVYDGVLPPCFGEGLA